MVTIPNCWFNITSLDAFQLSHTSAASADANMHSVFLARAYLEGLSVYKAVSLYQEGALFTDKALDVSLRETEEELRQRDRDLDFTITDYVLNVFPKKRLFYSYNHPSLPLLLEVCAGLMGCLCLPFQKDGEFYGVFDRLINPQWQIHPKIRCHFGLSYVEEPCFVFSGKIMNDVEFAAREFDLFARQDRELLAKDVASKEQKLIYAAG